MTLKPQTSEHFHGSIVTNSVPEIMALNDMFELFDTLNASALTALDKRIMCVVDPRRQNTIDFYIGDSGFSVHFNNGLYKLQSATDYIGLRGLCTSEYKTLDTLLDQIASCLLNQCGHSQLRPNGIPVDIITDFMDEYRTGDLQPSEYIPALAA